MQRSLGEAKVIDLNLMRILGTQRIQKTQHSMDCSGVWGCWWGKKEMSSTLLRIIYSRYYNLRQKNERPSDPSLSKVKSTSFLKSKKEYTAKVNPNVDRFFDLHWMLYLIHIMPVSKQWFKLHSTRRAHGSTCVIETGSNYIKIMIPLGQNDGVS